MNVKERGISNIISTLILVGIFLVVIVATSIFSLSVFEIESQNAEFSQAENNMVALAQIIEDVSLHPYSSNQLRFNNRVGRLNFIKNWKVITINITSITNSTQKWIITSNLNILEYRGGEKVGVAAEKILRGNSSLILLDETDPLGTVIEKQEQGAVITVDFGRIRVISLGTFWFKDEDGTYKNFTIIEIKYINLTLTKVYPGSGPTTVIFENLNITTTTKRFDPPVKITVETNGERLAINITESNPTIINFVTANIDLTFRGG